MVKRNGPRILLSLLFIVGGLGFAMNFSGTTQYVGMGLAPFGLAGLATIATVIAIVLKLGGGLMLLFNYRTSNAAWMLIIFTTFATIMYHLNWSGDAGQMQMTQFLKNLAIVGGLMMFAHCPCPQCNQEGCKEGDCCKTNAPTA
jgi:putative oxidoreductase